MTNYFIVKERVDECAHVVLVVEEATIERVSVIANASNEKVNIAIEGSIFMSIFVYLKSQDI
jgi:hypothetical protein